VPKEGIFQGESVVLCGKLRISTKNIVEMWRNLWIERRFFRKNKGKKTSLWIRCLSREKESSFRNAGKNSGRSEYLAGMVQRKEYPLVGEGYFTEKEMGFAGEACQDLRKRFSALAGGEGEENPGMFRAHENSRRPLLPTSGSAAKSDEMPSEIGEGIPCLRRGKDSPGCNLPEPLSLSAGILEGFLKRSVTGIVARSVPWYPQPLPKKDLLNRHVSRGSGKRKKERAEKASVAIPSGA
jgi:hypothetical protein